MKLAMVRLAPGLKAFSARLLLQIHDELIFEVEASQVQDLGRYVRQQLVEAYPLRVPLAASLKVGSNWCEVDTLVL
jgi:DNA polymerase-1